MCMCTLKNHVEKVCTLVSQNHVYFKFVYSVMASRFVKIDFLDKNLTFSVVGVICSLRSLRFEVTEDKLRYLDKQ